MIHMTTAVGQYRITFLLRSRNRAEIVVLDTRRDRTVTGKRAIAIAADILDPHEQWPAFALPLLDRLPAPSKEQPPLPDGEETDNSND